MIFKYDSAVRVGKQMATYKDKSGEFKFICTERMNDNKVINNIFIYQTKFEHLFTCSQHKINICSSWWKIMLLT
jgi:hypothetical protein